MKYCLLWCKAAHACSGREGKYFYYSKTLEGEQYRVSCRRRMPPGMEPPTGVTVLTHSEQVRVMWGRDQAL